MSEKSVKAALFITIFGFCCFFVFFVNEWAKESSDWMNMAIYAIFGLIFILIFLLLQEKHKRTYLLIDWQDSIEMKFLVVEDLLKKYDTFFRPGFIEDCVKKIKEQRKAFLTGKTKGMVSIKEFEDNIREGVVQLGVIERVFAKIEIDIKTNSKQISKRQERNFFKKLSAFRKKFARIKESAQKYADFRVN